MLKLPWWSVPRLHRAVELHRVPRRVLLSLRCIDNAGLWRRLLCNFRGELLLWLLGRLLHCEHGAERLRILPEWDVPGWLSQLRLQDVPRGNRPGAPLFAACLPFVCL